MQRQHTVELFKIAGDSPWFWPALQSGRALGLDSWCIGAGALRNLVWDHLHGFNKPSSLSDIDFAYFEAADLSRESEQFVQSQLQALYPQAPWEATNQARVHLWFEQHFGYSVSPLESLEQAVASWPEYATSVALTLTASGELEVIAPYGLEDLFSMQIRRNPTRVSVENFRERVHEKRYHERWPLVTIVPC